MAGQGQGLESESFKVRVWAILGDPGTGKSTTIRYLISQQTTGPGNIRDILLRGGGYLRLYASRRASQEARKSPEDVIKLIKEKGRRLTHGRPRLSICWLNVLMALRFDAANGCPPGHQYLSTFVEHGWLLESLVLMNYRDQDRREFYHDFGAPTLDLLDSTRMARDPSQHAWMVGQVRSHFGWA
jgi:hypothetical protein